MSVQKETQHSILVVSGSEAFEAIVRSSLPAGCFLSLEVRKSAAAGRRYFLERFYDIVVINLSSTDPDGIGLAIDAAEGSASVLAVAPRDRYEDILERLTDSGILVLPQPFPKGRMNQVLRFLIAGQNKAGELRRKIASAEEKTEELRLVSKAKFLLVEHRHMTEDAAHRLIGKEAMDHGISRRRAVSSMAAFMEGVTASA